MNELDKLNTYAAVHNVPVIMYEGLEFLMDQIEENQVKSMLEIGTAIARTSIALARKFVDLQIVTIERDPEMIRQARENIAEAGLQERITLIEGDARETDVPEGPYDLIFIDAAKSQYLPFFVKYAPLLSEDGIIISDNMNFHGMVDHPERTQNRHTKNLLKRIRTYRQFLSENPDYETQWFDTGDGIALTRRKKKCLDYSKESRKSDS